MAKISKSATISGRTLTLEVGHFAPQATAAVLGKYGETMVLVSLVEAKPREDLGYFPLTVDYIERLYAGGRIKGSRWVKREGRASDERRRHQARESGSGRAGAPGRHRGAGERQRQRGYLLRRGAGTARRKHRHRQELALDARRRQSDTQRGEAACRHPGPDSPPVAGSD